MKQRPPRDARAAATGLPTAGVALCLVSAIAYGTGPIFAKLVLREHVALLSLLTLRFAISAPAFAALAALSARGRPILPARRTVLAALALGCGPYASQVLLYLGAIQHMSASVASLLFYTYPAMVTTASALLRRARPACRRVAALALVSSGTAVVLIGGSVLDVHPLGCALALGSAGANTCFLLASDALLADAEPLALAALITGGSTVTLLCLGLAAGKLDLDMGGLAWTYLLVQGLVATVVAIAALLAGVARIGAPTASILSTIEPVVTIALATVVFSERLSPLQLLGGAGVVAAILVLQISRESAQPLTAADGPVEPSMHPR